MSTMIEIANCSAENVTGDVVFVHGLDGNPRTTWQNSDTTDTFWPGWLGEELPEVAVWSLGFEAASSKWNGTTMAVVDRATNLLAQLQAHGIGSRPLVFVAHSLGGLVVKQMLRASEDSGNKAWKHVSIRTAGIVFIATPHAGSSLANVVRGLRLLYRPSASVDDMCSDDPHLRDLNSWYRNNIVRLGIETLVFRETHKTHGVFIVPPGTSDPGLQGVVPIPVDADHVGICKPRSKEAEVYILTKKFIQDRLEAAAIGTAVVRPQEENIFVDIDVNNAYPPIPWLEYDRLADEEDDRRIDEEMAGESRTLHYELRRKSGLLSIVPQMPYLAALASGGPIYGVDFTWSPFGWQFPNLDFKVVNNSTMTICISEALFKIEKSDVDPMPVPVIPQRQSHSMFCQLQNEGWGPMKNVSLDFNLFPTEHGEDFNIPYKHHLELGVVEEWHGLQLADCFASLGVSVMGSQDRTGVPFVENGGLGPFANGYAILCGTLSYHYHDIAGTIHDVAVKLGTLVCLMPPRLGMYAPPTYQYSAAFESEGVDYEVRVPLSQSLRSGDMDRFNIRIAADKSSIHQFRFCFTCNGKALPESSPITLNLFVPRSQADKARNMNEE